MKKVIRIVAIATCLLWNAVVCFSSDGFPGLKTVVDDEVPTEQRVWIYGPNGRCAHVHEGKYVLIRDCEDTPAQRFFIDSVTHEIKMFDYPGSCVRSAHDRGDQVTQGEKVMVGDCDMCIYKCLQRENRWQLQKNGEILHLKSGLLLTAISGAHTTQTTLQPNVHSSFQTWTVDPTPPPYIRLAHIIGMNGQCLSSGNDTVFLGKCEARPAWLLYPDGTIRRESNDRQCIVYDNLINRRLVVTTCGIGATNERWVFTESGTVLNQVTHLVWEAVNNNTVEVHIPTGQPNQQWRI